MILIIFMDFEENMALMFKLKYFINLLIVGSNGNSQMFFYLILLYTKKVLI